MKPKRIILSVALLSLCVLATACTDQVDVSGIPTGCKDSTGKPVTVKVTLKILQTIDEQHVAGATHTVLVDSTGVAHFKIGATTQSKRIFQSGHRPPPPAPVEPNTIYTGDPVTVELRAHPPCEFGTKKLTGAPDGFSPQNLSFGGVRYVLGFDKFQ